MKETKAVREEVSSILISVWDPLQVSEVPEAQDEYDTYVGVILTLLQKGAATEEIRDCLLAVERQSMGLIGDESRALTAAIALKQLGQDW